MDEMGLTRAGRCNVASETRRLGTKVVWAMMLMAAALLGGATPVVGQGWIEPDVRPGVDRSSLAVEKTRTDVDVRIEGQVARIEVSEWFVNRGGRVAEGEYHYPLPGEAVFEGFSLFQGDLELRGEIMDAERARRIYEEIVRRRADPALIELAGQGLLRARVFPIQPGEERRVTLRYTQVLERAGNALQLAYVGGVRGEITRVGDRRPTSVPQGRGLETSFTVEVRDADRFLQPFSPTHELSVERRSGRMTVRVEEELGGRLSLFLPLAGEAVGLAIATHRPPGEAGYFMLTLSPGRDAGRAEPRDVTVVVDVSGSMSGEKIAQAKEALRQLLGTLSETDRFRLVAFSSAVRAESREWRTADAAAVRRATRWIDDLDADGGTNIEAALQEAFRLESPRDRLPVVLFLTDGLPSVGEESPERLAEMAERRAGRIRVFAFGVGHDVNTHLLDRLGQAGRGDTDYVEPGENVERALSVLAAKIRHPVLTDLALSGGRIDLDEVYPVRIPDVFAGQELVLFGRFEGEGGGRVTVRGQRAGRSLAFTADHRFPDASDTHAYIPRLWAARKLGHLERQLWTEGETASLVEEIRTLALRYGLPSRYTSYLVEEPGLVADGRIRGTPGRGPTAPAVRGGSSSFAPVPSAASGAVAVRAANQARQRRDTRSEADLRVAEEELAELAMERAGSATTRGIGGRLFRQRDGVWEDMAHAPSARVTTIRAFSAAYFEVVQALPELERIVLELPAVVVAGEEVSVAVRDEGVEELSSAQLAQLVASFRGSARR